MPLKIIFYSFLMFLISCDNSVTESPSSKLTNVPVLDVRISPENKQTLTSNKTINVEFPAQIVYKEEKYNGWIRPSGARSRTFPRWSFRIRLPESKNIEGLYIFNLSAQIHDQTMMYTTLATHLYKQAGFPTFKHKHTFLRLNKQDQGIYALLEKIDSAFFDERNLQVAELYKSGSQISFTFDQPFHPKLSFDKKVPDDDNYVSIVELINALDTSSVAKIETSLATFLDIDQYLNYHAITTLINNTDAFQNNFFLWKEEPASPFKIIPWDFDLSFNREKHVGLFGYNKIIEKLLLNKNTFQMYKSKLQTFVNTIYTEENLFPVIDSTANVIRQGYNIDPYLGAGPYEFDEEINKLKLYITDRRQFILSGLEDFNFSRREIE